MAKAKKKATAAEKAKRRAEGKAKWKTGQAKTKKNAALDRANAIAKKGTAAVKAAGARGAKAAADVIAAGKQKAPQFFGRPKVKKAVDPVKLKAERSKAHSEMMRLDWYRAYREDSIRLWVERRAAGTDKEAIEKINKKLDAAARKRDKARAEWKESGAKIPAAPPVKAAKAKKEKVPKKARKPKAAKATKMIETIGGAEAAEFRSSGDAVAEDNAELAGVDPLTGAE